MGILGAACQAYMLLTLLAALAPGSAVAADEFARRIHIAHQLIEHRHYLRSLEKLARAKPQAGDIPLWGMVLSLHTGVAFEQQYRAWDEDSGEEIPVAGHARVAGLEELLCQTRIKPHTRTGCFLCLPRGSLLLLQPTRQGEHRRLADAPEGSSRVGIAEFMLEQFYTQRYVRLPPVLSG